MKTIYYKLITVWHKYPWQTEVNYRYVEFYDKVKKKYVKLEGLSIEPTTSIKQKEDYLKQELKLDKVKVIKLKF